MRLARSPIASSDLDAAAQGFLEHRAQVVFLFREKPSGIRICVRLQERCATRAEGSVEHDLDCAGREMVVVSIENRSVFQELIGRFTRSENRIVNAEL